MNSRSDGTGPAEATGAPHSLAADEVHAVLDARVRPAVVMPNRDNVAPDPQRDVSGADAPEQRHRSSLTGQAQVVGCAAAGTRSLAPACQPWGRSDVSALGEEDKADDEQSGDDPGRGMDLAPASGQQLQSGVGDEAEG